MTFFCSLAPGSPLGSSQEAVPAQLDPSLMLPAESHILSAEENARLAALAEYDVLDTPAETAFDDIVFLASELCETPVALITLLTQDRQWFKARVGTDIEGSPISLAICVHALHERTILVIPDLSRDGRTKANPLVTGGPMVRFYAGAPLVTPAGVVLGTLCVLDVLPRPDGLTAAQARGLEGLARQVISQLELRRGLRVNEGLAREQQRLNDALLADAVASGTRSQLAQQAGRVGTFELDVATGELLVSPEFCRVFGLPVAPAYAASVLEDLIHPSDRNVGSGDGARRDGSAPPDVEYRIRRADDGALRWIARRSEFGRGAAGEVAAMFGTVQDVTSQKRLQSCQAALLDLGDRLREAETPADVVRAAAELLGTTLEGSRAGHARLDRGRAVFEFSADWTDGHRGSLAGTHPLSDFGVLLDRLGRGETIAVPDVASAVWLREAAHHYAIAAVKAAVMVPILDRGDLAGMLYVYYGEPRSWSKDEIDFVHGVADRVHPALAKVEAEAERTVLNQELSHRLKNTMAMVQAIAMQTLRGVPDRGPVEAFEKRLSALSAAHDVLLQESWSASPIVQIVTTVLANVEQIGRFEISGPDVTLGPRATLSLSLLLHELVTNALKYGSLSTPGGQVQVRWRLEQAVPASDLVLSWIERGGPPVHEPDRKGFGSRLLKAGLLGTGGVVLCYQMSGFQAELRAPIRQLQQL